MAESVGQDGDAAVGGKEEPVSSGAVEEKGDARARQESEDEEDVFEVESILDSKIEGGEMLYRVRWKGYDSDGDTWEPEAHLDDCKEVLLEFRRKQAESKQKAAKRETPPKTANIETKTAHCEMEDDSESGKKEEMPQKKKKKSKEEEDEEKHDELKKKKSKSGKAKEKTKPEAEFSESTPSESKPKKRLSESKEDLSSKKPKKDDSKKSKKEEGKDTKVKGKDAPKEKPKKSEVPMKEENLSIGPEAETFSVSSDAVSDEREKVGPDEDLKSQEMTPPHPTEELSFGGPADEEIDDVKLKKKKKKHKKKNDDAKALVIDEGHQDKKHPPKKLKSVEKFKEAPVGEKPPAPIQKGSRLSIDDKVRKSLDALIESKEAKKAEITKEKPKKKQDVEKEIKKDAKVLKTPKELKPAYDAFTISPEDKEDIVKKEHLSSDCRISEDFNKEFKQVIKERRSTQEETHDSWMFGSSEGDQEVMDTCHVQETSAIEGKPPACGMTMDLQLEWMTLEDFQRHLDGADEIIPKDPIPYSVLKEAVKNGDYITVKHALNSKEEYNLEQEDVSGMTLVMLAAAAGQDDVLRLLIRKGAKINSKQKNGSTALIHAAEKNHLTTVSILLDAGAFVNLQQVTGETALMKACKKGNYDIARLLIEQGADCNVLSKHQGNALQFAKQSNNVLLYDLINGHLERLARVVEDAIKDYFDARLVLLEPIFPITCHRLCEGPDFSLDFNYKPPYNIPEESGILLFIFHANFFGKEVVVRLCGSCSVQAVVLNDKFQLPVFLDAHFIYSFSPVAGANKLFIRLTEVPTAKVKLLICAYRVQLH